MLIALFWCYKVKKIISFSPKKSHFFLVKNWNGCDATRYFEVQMQRGRCAETHLPR